MKLQAVSRSLSAPKVDVDKREITFSLSSEFPVERDFGYEVLSHERGAVDASRIKQGAVPLLLNHNPDEQIGRVVNYAIRGSKLFVTARLSSSDEATQILKDVADGVRGAASVRYSIDEVKKLRDDEANQYLDGDDDDSDDDDDSEDDTQDTDAAFNTGDAENCFTPDRSLPTYLVSKWSLIEASLVSIPADPTVGAGRTEELFEVRGFEDAAKEPTSRSEVIISETMSAEASKPEINLESLRSEEITRMRDIQAFGERFGASKEAASYIQEGKSVADFQRFILENKINQSKAIETVVDPTRELPAKDQKRYSLVRAINALVNNKGLDGVEGEVHDELLKARAHSGIHGATGVLIPDFALAAKNGKRDMQVSTSNLGGVSVQTTVEPSYIDYLYPFTAVLKSGARYMPGLVGNLLIPRQTGAASTNWVSEVAAATESDQTLGSVELTPKRLTAWTNFSKQLLYQSSIAIEEMIRHDLVTQMAVSVDYGALYGTGSNNQPLGLFNYSANTSVSSLPYDFSKLAPTVGFGSGYPTYVEVLDFPANIESGNFPLDNAGGWIMHPQTEAAFRTYPQNQTSSGPSGTLFPIFMASPDSKMNGFPIAKTTQVTNGAVIFGAWDQLMIGQWGPGVELLADVFTLAQQAEVRLIANQFVDIEARYANAFCISSGSALG
jgi:HK97 family phage major capsid protein